jgi:hypothetical protein
MGVDKRCVVIYLGGVPQHTTLEIIMASITYEKETCGRCGGSGRYSFNQIDGDRCYGCGGSGQRLSKRGKAAKAFADERLNITVEQFAALEGRKARYTDSWGGNRTTFSRVRQEGQDTFKTIRDTEWQTRPRFVLMMRQEDGSYKDGTSLSASMTVRLIPTEEDVAEITAYQDSLTKAGKPRKR